LLANRFNKIAVLCLLNAILLAHTTWVRYNANSCPSCNQVSFLKVNGIYIAILGIVVSLVLAAIILFANRHTSLQYLALVISAISASFALYLQIAQFILSGRFCFPCLAAAAVFYIIFCILVLEILIRPRFSIAKGIIRDHIAFRAINRIKAGDSL